MSERRPAYVFHPGSYLITEINYRGLSIEDFAKSIGQDKDVVIQIVDGSAEITPKIAEAISGELGTTAKLWMNLERAYQEWKKADAPKEGE